ncbi:MAG: hypothetical protein KAV87_50635 [Desulfobacteraceae bacterium]|nr:hypothetical protein [Desulfobacteraceae bacterium]
MDKIHWFKSTKESCRGYVYPFFKIYKSKGNWILFIFDDRPESIPIESVRQGKIKAKKYLDAKIYEKFGE